jgi:hypothetical protein
MLTTQKFDYAVDLDELPLRDRQRRRVPGSRRNRAANEFPEFVGVDGESANRFYVDSDGVAECISVLVMLRAGDNFLMHEDRSPLRFRQIMKFLLNLPSGKKYVAFSFAYDVTMMIRAAYEDSRTERSKAALHKFLARWRDRDCWTERERLYGVKASFAGVYFIDYMPQKHLYVSGYNSQGKFTVRKISDVFGLFQSSFVKAIPDWTSITELELDHITRMKAERANFVGSDEEIAYNLRECELLAETMTNVRAACGDAGIRQTINFEGAGKIAQALLAQHNTPILDDRSTKLKCERITLPPPVMVGSNEAYYGGRFGICCNGPIPGPVYEYDINSAYPAAMADGLPCLLHGYWEHSTDVRHSHDTTRSFHDLPPTTMARTLWRWEGEETPVWTPFPIRRTHAGHGICYPLNSWEGHQDWYWLPEILAAVDTPGWYVECTEFWSWIQAPCACKPFDWITDLYAERVRIGKGGKGYVIKLGLNSLYGKCAQKLGVGLYFNPVWAGLITSRTRAKLFRAATPDVFMMATDAVYSTVPLDLPTDPKRLGAWDCTVIPDGMFVIQPGVYWKFDGSSITAKTRGVNKRVLEDHRNKIMQAWQDGKQSCTIDLGRVFQGVQLAYLQGHPERIGQWLPETKTLSFSMATNRATEFLTSRSNGTVYAPPIPFCQAAPSYQYPETGGFAPREDTGDTRDPDATHGLGRER